MTLTVLLSNQKMSLKDLSGISKVYGDGLMNMKNKEKRKKNSAEQHVKDTGNLVDSAM